MKRLIMSIFCIHLAIIFMAATALGQEKSRFDKNDQCVICHKDLEAMPENFEESDIHMQKGLSCAGCHGGDSTSDDEEVAKRKGSGFIGVPKGKAIIEMCGKCHSDIAFMRQYQPRIATDQVQQYAKSFHGQKLAKGDTKVATCASCHMAHSIFPAIDPRSTIYSLNIPETCHKCHSDEEYMKEYNIPTNQYDKYVKSVHGIALLEKQDTGAPACNDCHGNHGAMPPGISSIGHICGTCHVNNQAYFSKSKMAIEFEEADLHACEECHGNHEIQKTHDDMVGTGETSTCVECHDEGESAYETAEKIHTELIGLVTAFNSANVLLKKIERVGMDDLDMSYAVKDAKQRLLSARTLVHTFDADRVKVKTDEGLEFAKKALAFGKEELDELDFRRFGFGIATFFMTIVLVALYFKIKDMERDE